MRPDLVLLHGWGLHGGIWQSVAAALGDRQAVHTPDLPGYGDRPMVTPFTAIRLAEAMAGRHSEPVSIVGWSLGGMVALAWAALWPERVRAVVLVATNPCFVSRADWTPGMAPEVLAGFADDLARDYRATLLRFLSLQARGGDAAREVIGRLRRTVFERGDPAPEVLAAGLALLRNDDLRPLVAQVRCPVLVIHGARDGLCPPAAAEWLASTALRARLVLHPQAAHAPFLSHPDWFVARLREFLDEP